MNYKYLQALKFCEEELIEDIIVTDIFPDLRKCSYFTLEDEQYIKHEITDKAKAIKLIDIIREKNNECFEKFCDILSTTNEELAEILENKVNGVENITRKRRLSVTECGEILIKGGVPIRFGDYLPRPILEKQILNLVKSISQKPILIHGILGCGKSSIISNVLHNPEIFPDKFINCCWITIGNINQADVVNKLKILSKKLNFNKSSDITMSNVPEIIVEDIKKQLSDRTTLLIVHDICSLEVMKYFTFHQKYIVISQISNLFNSDSAEVVHIPEKFSLEECKQLTIYHDIDNYISEKIIIKSGKHPMSLNWICNLLKSNKDSVRLIDQLSLDEATISKQCIDVLDENIRDYFIMLMILPLDGTITVELLSIYWDVEIQKALRIITRLCDNNLMKKEWYREYNCNMYGVYNFYLNCLKNSNHKNKLEEYQKLFVERFFQKYKTWISINIPDPFFFMFYGNMLYNSKEFTKLTKLYCDYSFIAAKIAVCGISELVYDYEKYRPSALAYKWDEFENFLRKHSHIFQTLLDNNSITIKISKIFTRLLQCGLYEMKDSCTYKAAFENRFLSKRKDFWDWINPTNSIKIWENNYGNHIELIDINDYYLLMSTSDNRILLVELNTGICLFSYQFSKNPIILVKFIRDMDILIVDSKHQFWLFEPNNLVTELNSLIIDYDEEYDDDMDPPLSEETNSTKFLLFRKYFQNLSVDDFLTKCVFYSIINKKLDGNNLQAQVFLENIYFFNNNDTNTYIAFYDLKSTLLDDIIIDSLAKKHILNSYDSNWYCLQHDGIIALYDEFGNFLCYKIIPNESIVDFIVNENDIFCVARNNVYKNMKELFSVEEHLNISKISISRDLELLVLCLVDDTVQIWNHSRKEMLYSLHDSQFNNAYFLRSSNILITTGETNVAKWKIENLNVANYNNNHNDNVYAQSIPYYRRKFIMETSNSLLVLILQSMKNEIEFCTYDNEKFVTKTEYQYHDSIATCFTCLNDYVFIGFKSGIFQIYSLLTFKKICLYEMKFSTFEIVSLATYKIDQNNIGILVHHSNNKIMTYSFNEKNLNIASLNLDLPENVPKCKFFKIKEDLLICGVYNDEICTLHKIFDSTVCNIGYYDFEDNIIDLDITSDIQYLCMISTNGLFKTWEINSTKILISIKENYGILRKCKFRPRHDFNNWRLVAIINDKVQIYLYYFCGNKYQINLLIEEFSSTVNQIPRTLEWSSDSLYLLVGDNAIKKWKIRENPHHKEHVKLACTILQTYFGGIQCLQVQDDFIATIDQQGFLYVLKRLD